MKPAATDIREAVKERPARRYLAAMFAKTVADGLFWAAVGWLSAAKTDSDWQVAAVFAAGFAAYLLMVPAASAATERNAEKTLKLVLSLSAIPFVFLWGMWAFGQTNAWTLVAASFLQGCCTASLTFTRWTAYPRLAAERNRISFFAADTIGFETAKMVAPAIGGYLIAAGSPGWPAVAAVAAASVAIAAVHILRLPHRNAPYMPDQNRMSWRETFTGMVSHRVSRQIFFAGCILWAANAPSLYMIAAVAEAREATPQWFGWMGAAVGAGGIFGGLLLATNWNRKQDLLAVSIGSLALSAVGNVGIAVAPDLFLVSASLFLCGAAPSAGFSVMLAGMMNSQTEWGGRASAIWAAAIFGVCVPAALLTAGGISALWGLSAAFAGMAVLLAVSVWVLARHRKAISCLEEDSIVGFKVGQARYSEREPAAMFRKLSEIVAEHSGQKTAEGFLSEIDTPDTLEGFCVLKEKWLESANSADISVSIMEMDSRWQIQQR